MKTAQERYVSEFIASLYTVEEVSKDLILITLYDEFAHIDFANRTYTVGDGKETGGKDVYRHRGWQDRLMCDAMMQFQHMAALFDK